MSFSQDLRAFLLADATISGLVSTRVHPLHLPQNPTYPAITYQMISGSRGYHYSGADGLSGPRIQFDCWASTYLQIETLAEAVRQRLSGFKGVMGGSPGTVVQGAFFDSERDLHEPIEVGAGSGVGIYRRSIDYFIHYEEVAS